MHYAEIPDYVPVVLPLEGVFYLLTTLRRVDHNCFSRRALDSPPDHLVL